jgi:hypothetical protein
MTKIRAMASSLQYMDRKDRIMAPLRRLREQEQRHLDAFLKDEWMNDLDV